MRVLLACLFTVVSCLTVEESIAQDTNLIELSRTSGVKLISRSESSSGSGAFIGDQYVLTCFHVVASWSVQGSTTDIKIFPDLQVVLPSGETIDGTVVSVPTNDDPNPLQYDFAIVKLKHKPTNSFSKLQLAMMKESLMVGDDVVFSGYPLATPGMVTHRGMVSGFDNSSTLIFIQASINKGNSGGALLNSQGHIVGVVSMREGGISQGLDELQAYIKKTYIDKTSPKIRLKLMNVDPLQATNAIIQTLDRYISTGIGYAHSIKFAREYLERNPELLR